MDIVEMREFIAKTHIQIAREANKRKLNDKELTYYYTAVANRLLSSCESWAREEYIEELEKNLLTND